MKTIGSRVYSFAASAKAFTSRPPEHLSPFPCAPMGHWPHCRGPFVARPPRNKLTRTSAPVFKAAAICVLLAVLGGMYLEQAMELDQVLASAALAAIMAIVLLGGVSV
jgi:hypothetical protein